MFQIKKIICPTDFSEPARMGLLAGIELAEKFSAELILAHVIAPIPMIAGTYSLSGAHLPQVAGTQYPEMLQQMEVGAAEAMNDLINSVVPVHLHPVQHILQGRPADEIVHLAEKESADLIVIATHGHSGIDRFLFGSVTERVMRKAPCHVMAIRSPALAKQ
jgi:nucleotide-binding universal stress UspA family protein